MFRTLELLSVIENGMQCHQHPDKSLQCGLFKNSYNLFLTHLLNFILIGAMT